MKNDYDVPALKRAHDVLLVLSASPRPVKAATIAENTGLPRSTLYVLLDALERRKWIEKRDDGFIIGVSLFEFGNAYVRHDHLLAAFRQEASLFVARHNEVVQMAVLDGRHVVYIAREDAAQPVRLVSDLGSRLPAHCSALGKALLARLDDETIIKLLPAKLEMQTEHSCSSRSELLRQLVDVRASGIATEREEAVLGLACFAAFVGVTAMGKQVAISSSIPLGRLTPQMEKRIRIDVTNMASRIGKYLVTGIGEKHRRRQGVR